MTTSCPRAEQFEALARQRTGLEDFGDAALRAGLMAFAESMGEEVWPWMTDAARAVATEYVTHVLATRLRLVADRKAHPDQRRKRYLRR